MCKIHQGKNLAKCDSILKATDVREGVKKKPNLFGTKLWVVGSKGGSKVPNFLVKITIQLFLLIFRTLS